MSPPIFCCSPHTPSLQCWKVVRKFLCDCKSPRSNHIHDHIRVTCHSSARRIRRCFFSSFSLSTSVATGRRVLASLSATSAAEDGRRTSSGGGMRRRTRGRRRPVVRIQINERQTDERPGGDGLPHDPRRDRTDSRLLATEAVMQVSD